MLLGQPLERAPAHPFWFAFGRVEDAWAPPQTCSDPVRSACGTVARVLAGARVRELITVPAGKYATHVQDGHPPAATERGADKPGTPSAKITGCSCDPHGIRVVFPVTVSPTIPIPEDYTVVFGLNLDRGDRFAVACPSQASPRARPEEAFAGETPHVNR